MHGATGWSQTVESPARCSTGPLARAGPIPSNSGAVPEKTRSSPDFPVPPGPVGCPSGWRTFTVNEYRAYEPTAVDTAGNTVRRTSACTLVTPALAGSPRITVTS
ncbi:hypothetical protein [Nonomuraea sp. NPDC049709]|uniref:hypothetical protein n=1 Tax=Nonomuraea sp. NPDC049709 TaxID=3154736 RepID=UPI0034382909